VARSAAQRRPGRCLIAQRARARAGTARGRHGRRHTRGRRCGPPGGAGPGPSRARSRGKVPALACREHPARPAQEGAEVGVGETVAATDEEQGPRRAQRAQHVLRMGVAQHLLVAPDPEDDRLRLVPVAVQVEDRWLVAEGALDLGALPPGHRRPAAHILQEAVIIGRREREAEVAERFEHRAILRAEGSDGLVQPAPVLRAVRRAELGGDLLGRREQVVHVAGADLAQQPLPPAGGQSPDDGDAALDAILQEPGPGGRRRIARRADRDPGADDRQDPPGRGLRTQIRSSS
jgi:hypothetical protein